MYSTKFCLDEFYSVYKNQDVYVNISGENYGQLMQKFLLYDIIIEILYTIMVIMVCVWK